MRLHVQICLCLLVGVLTSAGSGGTIASKDSRIYFESDENTNQSGEEQTPSYPLWNTSRKGSRQNVTTSSSEVAGAQVSRVTTVQASGSTLQPPERTTSGVTQQEGTSEPAIVVKPLLDEDVLVAFEVNKMKSTQPPPTTAPQTTASTVVASQQPVVGGEAIPSQLEDILKGILSESEDSRESTTKRVKPPPRVDVTSHKPPAGSTENAVTFNDFIPQIEEVLKSILTKDKQEGPQAPSTAYPPLPQQPKLPVSVQDELGHILPALEEALSSVLNDSEAELTTTTRRPMLPTVHMPPPPDSRPHFAAVLPQLEDAIKSILEEAVLEEEAKAQQHTTQRPLPTQQPYPQVTKDYGFDNFMPELERVVGDILHNQKSNHSATFPNAADPMSTVKTPILPVTTTTTTTTTEEPLFQSNIIETDSPSTDSGSLFQAVKSTLEDVLKQQELEARNSHTGP